MRLVLGKTIIDFIVNIALAYIFYGVRASTWPYLFYAPMLTVASLQLTHNYLAHRIQTEGSTSFAPLFVLLVSSLVMLISSIITHSVHFMDCVFLLRYTIDSLCCAAEVLFCPNTGDNGNTANNGGTSQGTNVDDTAGSDSGSPFEDHGGGESDGDSGGLPSSLDHMLLCYGSHIPRRAFWSSLNLLYLLAHGSALQRPRAFYLLLFLHEIVELSIPLRALISQVAHVQYISRLFKRLSAAEVHALAGEPCSICLNPHNTRSVRLNCGHVLHGGCLLRMIQQSNRLGQPCRCPLCRADVYPSSSRSSSSQSSSSPSPQRPADSGADTDIPFRAPPGTNRNNTLPSPQLHLSPFDRIPENQAGAATETTTTTGTGAQIRSTGTLVSATQNALMLGLRAATRLLPADGTMPSAGAGTLGTQPEWRPGLRRRIGRLRGLGGMGDGIGAGVGAGDGGVMVGIGNAPRLRVSAVLHYSHPPRASTGRSAGRGGGTETGTGVGAAGLFNLSPVNATTTTTDTNTASGLPLRGSQQAGTAPSMNAAAAEAMLADIVRGSSRTTTGAGSNRGGGSGSGSGSGSGDGGGGGGVSTGDSGGPSEEALQAFLNSSSGPVVQRNADGSFLINLSTLLRQHGHDDFGDFTPAVDAPGIGHDDGGGAGGGDDAIAAASAHVGDTRDTAMDTSEETSNSSSNNGSSNSGNSNSVNSDGGNSNSVNSDGGNSNSVNSDGGNSNSVNSDGGNSNSVNSDGGNYCSDSSSIPCVGSAQRKRKRSTHADEGGGFLLVERQGQDEGGERGTGREGEEGGAHEESHHHTTHDTAASPPSSQGATATIRSRPNASRKRRLVDPASPSATSHAETMMSGDGIQAAGLVNEGSANAGSCTPTSESAPTGGAAVLVVDEDGTAAVATDTVADDITSTGTMPAASTINTATTTS